MAYGTTLLLIHIQKGIISRSMNTAADAVG